jgi:hypothetical protein
LNTFFDHICDHRHDFTQTCRPMFNKFPFFLGLHSSSPFALRLCVLIVPFWGRQATRLHV